MSELTLKGPLDGWTIQRNYVDEEYVVIMPDRSGLVVTPNGKRLSEIVLYNLVKCLVGGES